MDSLCVRCKGKGMCGKPCRILNKFIEKAPKVKLNFSGPSPPEVFVGRIGYPHVHTGILAPPSYDELDENSTAEEWSKKNYSVDDVLEQRAKLIYGQGMSHIKGSNQLKQVTQELALSHKSVSTEFHLKKKPTMHFTPSSVFRPMTNPAPIKSVRLEENPTVHKKVDYLTNDYDAKSVNALTELYKSNVKIDHLQKLLSVGLLGVKIQRRMVPTRWSITAVDDTISKEHLEKIRYFPEVDEILLFEGDYVGNYIFAILLPASFSFEAIEAWQAGNFYAGDKIQLTQDYEGFFGRKTYASVITGGYYAMRLPTTEYLLNKQKQATVFVFREITDEYYAPLGVGIVREATRRAYANEPKKFESVDELLKYLKTKIRTPLEAVKQKSRVLNNYKKQKTLKEFF